MRLVLSNNKLPLLLWQIFLLLTVTNPDVYLGLADIPYLPILICLCWLSNKSTKIKSSIRYLIFLLIYQIVPVSISVLCYYTLSTGYFFSYILWLLMFISTLSFNFSVKEIRRFCSAYVISGAIIAFIILFQRIDYYDSVYGSRYTIQILGHERFDPNFLAAYMVIPFILSLTKQLFNKTSWNFGCLILIIMGILYTGSRGAMISCAIGTAAIFYVYIKKIKKKRYVILGVLVFILLCFVALSFMPKASFARLFLESYTDSSNQKRFLDWAAGLSAFSKSWLLGYGMQGEMQIIKREVGVNMIAHNTYIAFLLQYGVLGTSIMFAGIIALLNKSIRYKEYIVTGMIISTLFVVFFISGEVAVFLWVPLIVSSVILQANIKQFGVSLVDMV